MILAQMGHVVGGWEYVWAAYILTWAGMGLYGLSLYVRRSKEKS